MVHTAVRLFCATSEPASEHTDLHTAFGVDLVTRRVQSVGQATRKGFRQRQDNGGEITSTAPARHTGQ